MRPAGVAGRVRCEHPRRRVASHRGGTRRVGGRTTRRVAPGRNTTDLRLVPQPIPERARRDAVCCSVRCRQARHRFLRAVGHAEAVARGRALRLAYADPPYPGNARLYRDHPDYGGEVDHAGADPSPGRIRRMGAVDLGRGAPRRAGALPAGRAGRRVAPRRAAHRSRWPLHAWEPVIYCGGRQLIRDAGDSRRVDSVVCGVAAVTTLRGRVIGAKPAAVCRWIFDLLGARPGDSLDDLFPGSGAVGRAWAAFHRSVAPALR